MSKLFSSLDLDNRLLENLESLSFLAMTPIQEVSLPIILEGKDLIAQAKTGSGKTVAFGLGLVNKIEIKQTRPQGLILCPTRELAEQVALEIRRVARMIPNMKILTITGGKSEYQQEKSLMHGAHIVVGTPGRVLKLLKKRILKLDFVHSYVLDEADRMLDMGFIDDIHHITHFLPEVRQTLLFSATFPEDIKDLSYKIQKDAQNVKIDATHSSGSIDEKFILVDSHKHKIKALLKVLGESQVNKFIVFCKTKRIADVVADDLYDKGIEVSSIHGDLDQIERTIVLTMFSNQSLLGIIATDVTARGIHIKDLDLVVNFDLPHDPEIYIHRIGRTARAGKRGQAISFMVKQEDYQLKNINEYRGSEYKFCLLYTSPSPRDRG